MLARVKSRSYSKKPPPGLSPAAFHDTGRLIISNDLLWGLGFYPEILIS